MKIKKHRHRWHISGQSITNTTLSCRCGEHRDRPASKQEVVDLKQQIKEMTRRSSAIHRVWHAFQRKFFEKANGHTWKWTGYNLMCKIERWAKKYPKDIFSAGIDDSHHAGSDIYFILHRDGKKNWGTTVIVITQCDGQPPCEYFMYPGHAKGIIDILKKINKMPRT